MKNKISSILNEERPGFQGLTHWLMTICLFFLMWLIPWSFANGYIKAINSSKIFLFIIFFTIGGASLLPDLDSNPLQGGGSAAIYQLGFLGEFLSLIEITISGVIYSIMHTRYDKKPESQHRMLFHAPIIPIGIWFFVKSMPNKGALSNNFDFAHSGIIILVFFAGASVYLGSNMLIYKLLKLIGKQHATQFICLGIMFISLIMMYKMPFSQLKLVGEALALGYLFHILEDVLTKGSAPLFFPIPTPVSLKNITHLRFWWHPYIISSKFTVTTGGILNIILNFVFMFIDAFLAWYLFIK